MKNNLLIISTAIFCFNLNASDTITLKNRKVIHTYIIEKSDTKIKYRTDSINNVESTNNMKLGRIRTIHYNNGDVDLLSSRSPRNVFPLGIDVGANFFLYGILLNGKELIVSSKIDMGTWDRHPVKKGVVVKKGSDFRYYGK
jgi:hypothetical protein